MDKWATVGRLMLTLSRAMPIAVLVMLGFSVPHLALAEQWQGRSIHVFAGSVINPALEELGRSFEQSTGARVYVSLGGSGALLSQIELARRGDIYLPGSSDYMEKAKRKGLVEAKTEVRLAYLIPAINVAKGNPRKIRTLKDLTRPDLRVGIARPDAVCVGLYAVENLAAQGLDAAVRPNIVNFAESCQKTAQMLSLGLVDAVLGWAVFSQWEPDRIETVFLAPAEVSRIGYIPAALTTFSEEKQIARGFL